MGRAQGSKDPGLEPGESPAPDAMPDEQVNNAIADSAWGWPGFCFALQAPSKGLENKGLFTVQGHCPKRQRWCIPPEGSLQRDLLTFLIAAIKHSLLRMLFAHPESADLNFRLCGKKAEPCRTSGGEKE